MFGPRKPANLKRRGDTWHMRVYVPKNIVPLLRGKREITKSLGTTDKPTARLAAENFRNVQFLEFERLAAQAAKPVPKLGILADNKIVDLAREVYADFDRTQMGRLRIF